MRGDIKQPECGPECASPQLSEANIGSAIDCAPALGVGGLIEWSHVSWPQPPHSHLPDDGFPTFLWGRPVRMEEQMCLPLGPVIAPSQLHAIIPQGPNEHLPNAPRCYR